MPATNFTSNLKLKNPVEGSFGWHADWYDMTQKLDNHPGILACTDSTYPADPWAGQVVYVSDLDILKLFNGSEWRNLNEPEVPEEPISEDGPPGILICTSTTLPADPYLGQVVYASDIDTLKLYNGSEWRDVVGGANTSVAMNWVYAADLVAGGTVVAEGEAMTLLYPIDIAYRSIAFEVQCTPMRTDGDGGVSTWVRLRLFGGELASHNGFAGLDTFSPAVQRTLDPNIIRKIVINTPVSQAQGSGVGVDQLDIHLRAQANTVGTSYTVSNVRARIIYTPI